jgi:hypothetical protein
MTKRKKHSARTSGGTATEDPILPAYEEGHVESVQEGSGQSRDEDPRTGQPRPADEHRRQEPKLSDNPDPFVSSELVGHVDPKKTS